MSDAPHVIVVAGPNGAGKTTHATLFLQDAGVADFVNADVIARGLSHFRPESVALEAGRMMLERLRHLAERRQSFAFETTLASRTFAPWIRETPRRRPEPRPGGSRRLRPGRQV
jgi:predicted ABC-type ATPase